MKILRDWITGAIIAIALLFALRVFAQTFVQPTPCNVPVQQTQIFPMATTILLSDGGTLVGLDGGAQFAPTTLQGASAALKGRKNITVCNGSANLGTPQFRCRWDWDGGWPTTTTGISQQPGATLLVGDCLTLALPSGTPVRCVTAGVDAGLEITECK